MIDGLTCWKCGADLQAVQQPLSRSAECPACTTDLHVCRMCRHFDASSRRGCREPVAEEVRDRERANFCGWFQPAARAAAASGGDAERSKDALAELFGLDAGDISSLPGDADGARAALDALFPLDTGGQRGGDKGS